MYSRDEMKALADKVLNMAKADAVEVDSRAATARDRRGELDDHDQPHSISTSSSRTVAPLPLKDGRQVGAEQRATGSPRTSGAGSTQSRARVVADVRHRRRRQGPADADQQHLARIALAAHPQDAGRGGLRRDRSTTFKRVLGPFDATMVVIGGHHRLRDLHQLRTSSRSGSTRPPLVLVAWVIGGAIALAGALCYAELGALFPKAGGQYVYLREGLHPLAGFLYGWALLLIIETGAIAAVAIAFATYALHLVGGPDDGPRAAGDRRARRCSRSSTISARSRAAAS